MFTKLKMIAAAVLISFSAMPFAAAAQDFDRGLEAYEVGDYATALEEFKPLAEQGDIKAQANLGFMYDIGSGVLKDETEAVKWYRLAAKQGYAQAQCNLGTMYEFGRGVLTDMTSAHMWYNISSSNGMEDVRSDFDAIEQQMTREQIAEATRRAKVCIASDYSDCD